MAMFCWKCNKELVKVAAGPRRGQLAFVERAVAPGQFVWMHVVCSESFDRERAEERVTARPREPGPLQSEE